MTNGMNVGKSNFGSLFKNWGGAGTADPAPAAEPNPAPQVPVPQPMPVAPVPLELPAPAVPPVPQPAAAVAPVQVSPMPEPQGTPAAPVSEEPVLLAAPEPATPAPQAPSPAQEQGGSEDQSEETDEEVEEAEEEEGGEPAAPETTEGEAAAVPDVVDTPELPAPTGEVFGHLASLMGPGSALAFTLSLGEDGRLTAQVKPLNLPALAELTLTGTVEEFDSAELLYALREYRPAVQGGLRDQARSQAKATQTKVAKPTTSSPAPTAASDRNKGKLKVKVDVPGATLKATVGGHGTTVQIGENDLAPGRYSVEASAEGYKTAKQTVKVERGKTAELAFTLGGSLEVQAPGGAAVTVLDPAGNPVNPAGPLPEGMYKVLVETEQKKPFTWHGTVKAGAPTKVTATLEDAPQTLFGS